MKLLVISGNPKQDGLCAAALDAVKRGAEAGGAVVDVLDTRAFLRCRVCGDGWGTCRAEHRCVLSSKDNFDAAQARVEQADALCLVTPVYWSEMAEGLKCFLDRLRRCEFGASGKLSGKQTLLVASPGGSGNGAVECMDQMDRFCRHTGAVIFDYIGVNRWNNDYKKAALYGAAKALAQGRKAGETWKG